MTPSILNFSSPVVAHRGASAVAPENTLAAFREARRQGAAWIEFDVKISQDGVPFVMHDDTVDRTTSGRGMVADMPWSELRALDAGSWFDARFRNEPVPHLAETMRLALELGLCVNAEIKPCPGRAKATTMVALIEMAQIWPDYLPLPLISSFDLECLDIAQRLHERWPRGLLLDGWRDDVPALVKRYGVSSVHMNVDAASPDHVRQICALGAAPLLYTVNTPDKARAVLDWGVAAVFSDTPGAVLKVDAIG